MEQLADSELQQLANEIQFYKQQTAYGMIEIGKRLIRAKENLKHGEWLDWLQNQAGIGERSARNFMRAAREFGNRQSIADMKPTQVIALLDMPVDEREDFISKPHRLSSGEVKNVDQMTVREIEEAKRLQREAEQRAQRAEEERKKAIEQAADIQRANRTLREQNEQLKREKNPEPQVIEKIVEVEKVPEHVQKQLDEDKFTINALRHSRDELKTRIQTLEMQLPDKFDVEAAELKKKRLQMDADINVLQLVVGVKEFLQRHAITAYASGALAASEPTVKRKLNDVLSQLDDFVRDVQAALNNRIIVEEATYQEAY